MVPITVMLMPLASHLLQLFPLVWREDFAEAEEHPGIGFFEIGARLGDGVDLVEDFVFVQIVGLQKRVQRILFFLQRGIQLLKLRAVLVEDVVHPLLLGVSEVELLRDVGIVPPAAVVSVMFRGRLAVVRRLVRRGAALGDGRGGGYGKA